MNYDSIKSVQELKATFGIGSFTSSKSSSRGRGFNVRKVIRKMKNGNKGYLKGKKKSKKVKKAKIQYKKTKVLRDLPNSKLELKKSKNKKYSGHNNQNQKKKVLCFLSDSEFETKMSPTIKCFRPKNINETGKSKLLKLIRRKT